MDRYDADQYYILISEYIQYKVNKQICININIEYQITDRPYPGNPLQYKIIKNFSHKFDSSFKKPLSARIIIVKMNVNIKITNPK
jgi:hypothetical protein